MRSIIGRSIKFIFGTKAVPSIRDAILDLEDPVTANKEDLFFVKFLTYFSAECVLGPPPCTPGPTADIGSWWSTRRVLKRRLTQKRQRLG
jgi:hypothetical protein